eukprot:scaffold4855_cov195-Amphora_coffeaeformis.AAC.1
MTIQESSSSSSSSSQWWVLQLLDDLRDQHAVDLTIYRSAHQNVDNVRLHYVLIPCEVASFLWLFTTISSILFFGKNKGEWGMILVSSLGWTFGLVSCAVAADVRLGWAVLLFHVTIVHICQRYANALGFTKSLVVGLMVWTASWGLQIGVGHYVMEGKPPNLLNPDDKVSLLSAMTSITLAWEC